MYSTLLIHAVWELLPREPVVCLEVYAVLLCQLGGLSQEYEGMEESARTVYWVMRVHGVAWKTVERHFLERNEQQQRALAAILVQISIRCVISIDETHTSGRDAYKKCGRMQRFVACASLDRAPSTTPRTSKMMAASTSAGKLWRQTVLLRPAQNADEWWLFRHDQLEIVEIGNKAPGQPWETQRKHCPLQFESAARHEDVTDASLLAIGAVFLRLPQYSRCQQAIDGVCNELKWLMKDRTYFNSTKYEMPRRLLAATAGMLTHALVHDQFIWVSIMLGDILM